MGRESWRAWGVRSRRRGAVTGAVWTLLLGGTAEDAWAHGAPLDRAVNGSDWNFDAALLLNLILVGWLYARGWRTLRQRGGNLRGLKSWQPWCLVAGGGVLVAVLISPWDPLSEQLAWAHMVQHMVLMTIAAPLVVLAKPELICLWGLSARGRSQLGRLFSRRGGLHALAEVSRAPLLMWVVYAVVTWGWHVPVLYDAAVRKPWVHDLQHASFFLAAVLYWRTLIDPLSRRRLVPVLAVVSLFATTLHTTVLGVLMTIAPRVWYPVYETRAPLWGLSPLEDQQLAGLIMWMPACAAYLLAAIVLLMMQLESTARGESTRVELVGRGA